MSSTDIKIVFSDALEIIEQYCEVVDASAFNHLAEREFIPCSIKNIVENGIYYLMGEQQELIRSIHNSIILTNFPHQPENGNVVFVVHNPQLVHYKVTALLEPKRISGVHITAIVSESATIHPTAYIGPYCCVGDAVIGENACLQEHVVIKDNVSIGRGTVIDSGTVIGARGMAWIWDEKGDRVMQPQLGGVVIGDDCIIGTNISIVRGSLTEDTIIGNGTVIAHGSMIGHGSVIGELVHFANNVSLAGNARVGSRVFLGSSCVVSSNVSVGEGCIVGAGCVVHKSFNEKNVTIAGVPAQIIKKDNFNSKPSGAPKPFKNS